MIRSILLLICIFTFFMEVRSQNFNNPPRVSLSDSTNATFPQDSSVVICERFAPLVFNASGCSTPHAYWKYFDKAKGIRVDTLSPNVEIYGTTTLYVSCSDEEPFSPNQPGLNIYIAVQALPGKPNLALSNNSIVQCLTDERLYINSNCNAAFTTTVWQDGSRNYSYKVTQNGTYSARCVNQCGVSSETDSIVVDIQDSFTNYKPNISATKTLLCGNETATIYLDNPLPPNEGFIDNSLFETRFNNSSPNTTNDSLITVSQTGSYFLIVTSRTCGSVYSDTLRVLNGSDPPLISTNNTTVCGEEEATLTGSCQIGGLQWSNGMTTPQIKVSAGTYTAVCINSCGTSSSSDEITISPPNSTSSTCLPITFKRPSEY